MRGFGPILLSLLPLAGCSFDWKVGPPPGAEGGVDGALASTDGGADAGPARACQTQCTCNGGESCSYECTGVCALTCKKGSVCRMRCSGGTTCSLTCEQGADCTLDGTSGTSSLDCNAGATCKLNCTGGICNATCNGICTRTCSSLCPCDGPNCN